LGPAVDGKEGSAAASWPPNPGDTGEPEPETKKKKRKTKPEKKWTYADAYANERERRDILKELLAKSEDGDQNKRKKTCAGERKVAQVYLDRKGEEAKDLPGVSGMKHVLADHQLYVAMFAALGQDFRTDSSPISRMGVLNILRSHGVYELLRTFCWQVQEIGSHVELELDKAGSSDGHSLLRESNEHGSLKLIRELVLDLEKARAKCGKLASPTDEIIQEEDDEEEEE
jgi:hypothetical protein